MRTKRARGLLRRHSAVPLVLLVFILAGCATVFNKPVNTAFERGAEPFYRMDLPEVRGDTAVALAFSGGGTRAAAFSFGVLRGLEQIQTPDGQTYADRVVFISGVSGGAITAAYFGLKARAGLADFRERFLIRDAEENLTTAVNLATLLQGVGGGVNEASKLTAWLDRNLYDGATMADLFKPGQPIISINASDLYNRTPFHFSPETFNALCSDLRTLPVSQAVAASAAVPVAFTPIVLENFPDSCTAPLPPWVTRALANPNAGAQVRAYANTKSH